CVLDAISFLWIDKGALWYGLSEGRGHSLRLVTMRFVVTGLTQGHELEQQLVEYVAVREVVNLFCRPGAASFTDPPGAFHYELATAAPFWGLQVCVVLTPPLTLC